MYGVLISTLSKPNSLTIEVIFLGKSLVESFVICLIFVLFNIASGSEANMTTLCEMDFLNFKWLI